MNDWIVFSDEHLLVVNKPAGILSQKDSAAAKDIVWYLKKTPEFSTTTFLAPVHRLDRNTSGLLVLAKNSAAAAILTKAIATKKMKRIYTALVKGDPGVEGKISLTLSKDEDRNFVAVDEEGKEAVTVFRRIRSFPTMTLLSVELLSGRSHQIRVHLAHLGHEVIGDQKYGKKPWNTLIKRPALHASKIHMQHPITKKDLKFAIPLPEDIQLLVNKL